MNFAGVSKKKLPVPWCKENILQGKQKTEKKKSNNDDHTFHDIRFSTTTIMIAIINVILSEIL